MTIENDPDNLYMDISPDLTPEQRARVLRFRERIYPVMSPEEHDRSAKDMRNWFDQGFCQPKMEPSLLGLDWSAFKTRKFPDHDGQVSFWNPPEFISRGYSALDAYATAMLAAHFNFDSLGVLTFTCELEQRAPECELHLEFATISERGRINPHRLELELLRSFSELVRTKGFEAGAAFFLEGEGCRMACEYPGRMVAKLSPFLRDRSTDLWPQASLSITPTDELRRRAQDILAFLRDSEPIECPPS